MNTPCNTFSFATWERLLAYVKRGNPVWYQAPLDVRPTRLTQGKKPFGYEPRARTVRIYPPGRGKARTSDPFTADAGHLDRFRGESGAAGPLAFVVWAQQEWVDRASLLRFADSKPGKR